MRKLSFLASRRWILFLIAVVVLSWGAWWLGEWQFHRLEDRKEQNSVVDRNIDAAPVPVDEVFSTDAGLPSSQRWRQVTATGEYDVDNTIVVRYRTRDSASGIDVVVPFITKDGTALVVDRGWMATDNSGTRPEDVPAPPEGTVTIVGWARQDATGDSTKVDGHSTRAISSTAIAEATGLTTYRGFVDVTSEDPGPETSLEHVQAPDRTNGPHFFYGLQWWFFGLLAIVGFIWMAVDEYRGKTGKRPDRELRRQRQRQRQRSNAAARQAVIAKRAAMEAEAAATSQRAKDSAVDGDDRARHE
ncbi:SURF1 family cytochrome oxidase biogenesis protein [Nocardioides alcanivorans]|uniref:SURF1 family cytochrome oxidase biogenesis protein n=1 Tax=Nocardioides alcanivorans TaxID=2897352 RepID=UPI001F43B5CE|nr:SURF1 family protein [Nocardioides alcanivorans]